MSSKVASFKILRRLLAVAIFSGRKLEYLDVVHLTDDPELAADTLNRFFGWAIENFRPGLAAMSISISDKGKRVRQLSNAAEQLLLSSGIPVWKVEDKHLLESYGVPGLKNKGQLRSIVLAFWPDIERKQIPAFEAAAAGLYVQIERLLSNH